MTDNRAVKRIKAAACFLPLLFILAACAAGGDVYNQNLTAETHAVSGTPVSSITEPETAADSGGGADTVLTFLAAGDNIVYRGNVGEAKKYAEADGREYNFKHQYTEVESLVSGSDIAFINQETLMAGDGYEFSYYPRFNGPQDMGYDLVELGFDIVNIANNHMLDLGEDGLRKTVEFWRNDTSAFITGDHLGEDGGGVRIYEKQGIKIAFLSYTSFTNLGSNALMTGVTIPYLEEETVIREIGTARAEADLVFVSVHWGDESSFRPNAEQIYYAQLICDLGADVIIGHHPHVIQPVVWLEGKNGNQTLCAYSLGNFTAEMENDYNMAGGLLTFTIVSGQNGPAYIADPLFIPTVYYFNMSFRNNKVYFLKDFTEELAAGHGIGSYGNSMTLEKLKSYVTGNIDAEFLPDYMK